MLDSRTHIGGTLRYGVTREYLGVAAAINGVAACRKVFAAADNK